MMKIQSTLILATMIVGIGLTWASSTSQAETFDGVNSGEIEINGSIGKLENTDPETNLPEGSADWINITVDTATAFHTTIASNHQNIESATYSITNHSGRGVAVYLDGMTGTPKYVNQLSINPDDSKKALATKPTAVNLIAEGAFTEKSAMPWLVLANNMGELKKDSGQNFGHSVAFNFTGKSHNLPTDVATKATAENYQLTLKFASIQADGTIIGQ